MVLRDAVPELRTGPLFVAGRHIGQTGVRDFKELPEQPGAYEGGGENATHPRFGAHPARFINAFFHWRPTRTRGGGGKDRCAREQSLAGVTVYIGGEAQMSRSESVADDATARYIPSPTSGQARWPSPWSVKIPDRPGVGGAHKALS
ncbi:hypothetical protein N7462_004969 [Penicillium macrosclerotiorum]|uniref:uncharacterized protein n=1 Tax=Penicillium macrosclerotiorum TaxID=303699 RepID=UPI002546EE7B|nr:uncharacterized protein N7462_004969 [Penicillium macrosclerotiorum]KAJ5690577.1 hypothetical protein N7462_004969 [Penicillium macrosclerotiorum]